MSFIDFCINELKTYEGMIAWTSVRSKKKLFPNEKNCDNIDALIGSWLNPVKGTVKETMSDILEWSKSKNKNMPSYYLTDRKVWLKFIPNLYVIDIDEVKFKLPRADFRVLPATKEEVSMIMELLYSKFPFLKDCPYTLSKNRRLPHIYIKITDIPKFKQEIGVFNHTIGSTQIKGDLLKNKGVVESMTTEIFNYNPAENKYGDKVYKWNSLNWNDISSNFDTEKMRCYYIDEEPIEPKKIKKVDLKGDYKKIDIKILRDVLEKIVEKEPEFFDDYYNWWCLTVILATNFSGETEVYDLYDEVCKTSSKYDEKNNKKVWSSFINTEYTGHKLTVGTIFHWATELGIDIKSKSYSNHLFKDDDMGEKDLATLFVMEYAKENARYDFDTKTLYIWNEQTKLWDESYVEKGMLNKLTIKIDDVIVPLIEKVKKETYNQMIEDGDDAKDIQKKQKFYNKLVDKLKKSSFRNCLWQDICHQIQDNSFKTILNSDKEHIATPTKLINLRTLEVRERTKDDFWTKTTPYEYIQNPKDQEKLYKYLSSLFVDNSKITSKELLNFVQIVSGYGLTNSNHLRKIFIMYGKGANGKSSFTNLVKEVIGDFANSGSDCILLDTDKSRNKPELDTLRISRSVFIDEIDPDRKLNVKNVKNVCGENDITYKMPYDRREITFKCNSKIYTALNDKPNFKASDQAMVDRLVIIPFKNRFIYTDKSKTEKINYWTKKYNEMYKGKELEDKLKKKVDEINANNSLFTDQELSNKQKEASEMEEMIKNPSKEFLQTLFCWLVEGAQKSFEKNLVIPQLCKDELEDYIEENDYISSFVEETYTTVSSEEWEKIYKDKRDNCISITMFKKDLTSYCKENNIQHTLKIKELEQIVKDKFGEIRIDNHTHKKYVRELVFQNSNNVNPMLIDDNDE